MDPRFFFPSSHFGNLALLNEITQHHNSEVTRQNLKDKYVNKYRLALINKNFKKYIHLTQNESLIGQIQALPATTNLTSI